MGYDWDCEILIKLSVVFKIGVVVWFIIVWVIGVFGWEIWWLSGFNCLSFGLWRCFGKWWCGVFVFM